MPKYEQSKIHETNHIAQKIHVNFAQEIHINTAKENTCEHAQENTYKHFSGKYI